MAEDRKLKTKQASSITGKTPKLSQGKSHPMHTFQVGVPNAEMIYQKVQYIKKNKGGGGVWKAKRKKKKTASIKFTFGRDKSSFSSMS